MVVGSNPAVPTNFKVLCCSKPLFLKDFYLSPAVIISIWIQVHPTKLTVLLTVLLVRMSFFDGI